MVGRFLILVRSSSLQLTRSIMNFQPSFNVKLPLSTPTTDQFLGLKPPAKCQATYVWVDETGELLRSKTRTLTPTPASLGDFPVWNYAHPDRVTNSDLYLHPRAVFQDPFLGPNARLIMCDTYTYEGQPTETNFRHECAEVMDKCVKEHPWFGMEQEYLMLDRDGWPLGWPKHGFPGEQGPYYCGVGADRIFGREVVETHYRACLWSGIDIRGANAEVTPGQWEFQVGPCEGVSMGDELWMARYLLNRVAEQFGVLITFDPKPAATSSGEWNGAGCHCNFSTSSMRASGGLTVIEAAMPKLERFHAKHLRVYDTNNGLDNLRRLSGRFETSTADKFTWGVADRGASVRIPRQVAQDQKGYLEDRRPSSNCDPYRVTAAIASAVLLD